MISKMVRLLLVIGMLGLGIYGCSDSDSSGPVGQPTPVSVDSKPVVQLTVTTNS